MSVESRDEIQTSEILQDTMPSSTPLDTDGETLTHDSSPYTLSKVYRWLVAISKAVLGEATRRNGSNRVQGLEQTITGKITSSSTAVTGSSTLFLTELYVGAFIAGTAGEYREVAAIASDVALTLVTAFSTDIGSAQNFTRLQMVSERLDAVEKYVNAVMNGDLAYWNQGTSFSTPATDTQLADAFYAHYDGTIGTFAVTQNAFTLGQTDVPGEPQYNLRWNQTATGSGQTVKQIRHKISGVRSFAGQTMQITFYAKMGSSADITVGATQYFGTGGSPSSYVTVTAKTRTMLTAFSRHTITLAIPAITGKTIGSNADDALYINFNLPLNATHDFYLSNVSAYAGTAELQFKPPTITKAVLAFLRSAFDVVYAPLSTGNTLFLNTYGGYGGTDTKIPYFTTAVTNTLGSAATLVNDSTNGCKVTIAKKGIWAVTYTFEAGAAMRFGLSLNSAQLTTDINSITASARRGLSFLDVSGDSAVVAWTALLDIGDVVRPHNDGTGPNTASRCSFEMVFITSVP